MKLAFATALLLLCYSHAELNRACDDTNIKEQNMHKLILSGFQPNDLDSGKLRKALEKTQLFKKELLHVPGAVTCSSQADVDSKLLLAESFSEMSTKTASEFSAGIELGESFEAGVKLEYTNHGAVTTSTKLMKFSMVYDYASQTMRRTDAFLRGYLTDDAKAIINDDNITPSEVYSQLPPFYVRSLSFGGIYSYYASTESTEEFSLTQFSAAIHAHRSTEQMSAEVDITNYYEVQVDSKSTVIAENQLIDGGDSAKYTFSSTTTPSEWIVQEAAYVDSVQGQLAVIGLEMQPIYHLASNSDRRDELKKGLLALMYPNAGNSEQYHSTSLCGTRLRCWRFGRQPKPDGSVLTSDGHLTISGSFYKSSYKVYVNGDLTVKGDLYKNDGVKIIVNGDLTVEGDMYKNVGDIEVNGDIIVDGGSGYFYGNEVVRYSGKLRTKSDSDYTYDNEEEVTNEVVMTKYEFYDEYIKPNLPITEWRE